MRKFWPPHHGGHRWARRWTSHDGECVSWRFAEWRAQKRLLLWKEVDWTPLLICKSASFFASLLLLRGIPIIFCSYWLIVNYCRCHHRLRRFSIRSQLYRPTSPTIESLLGTSSVGITATVLIITKQFNSMLRLQSHAWIWRIRRLHSSIMDIYVSRLVSFSHQRVRVWTSIAYKLCSWLDTVMSRKSSGWFERAWQIPFRWVWRRSAILSKPAPILAGLKSFKDQDRVLCCLLWFDLCSFYPDEAYCKNACPPVQCWGSKMQLWEDTVCILRWWVGLCCNATLHD